LNRDSPEPPPLLYDLRHVTVCSYGATVTYSRCNLRCLPKEGSGQRIIESSLEITPAAVESNERRCFFGNRVVHARIETPHRELRAEARARVEVDRPPPPQASPAWEDVRDEAFDSESLEAQSPAHFVYPSRFVPMFEPAVDYARESFSPRRAVLDAARELMGRIRRDFRYDPKATDVRTPLAKAFEQRRGVCQDFTHIMIGGLRGLGLPAAYVSGYIRTIPPEGKPRLEGADATHAWVSLWCGREAGFVDLDPTNNLVVANDHIILAHGRDYSDISPIHGIVLGAGEQEVDVGVDVVPVEVSALVPG
jgi:transglutaminase-like putative cysteine protease